MLDETGVRWYIVTINKKSYVLTVSRSEIPAKNTQNLWVVLACSMDYRHEDKDFSSELEEELAFDQ